MEFAFLSFWIICGAIAGSIYKQKDRSFGTGCLVGVLFGPLGIIFALVTPTAGIKCPFCAETIKYEAVVCRHCGREVPEDIPRERQSSNWSGPLVLGAIIIGLLLIMIAIALIVPSWLFSQ